MTTIDERVTDTEVVRQIARSPEGQAARKELQAEVLEKRRELVKRIGELNAAAAEAMPELRAAEAKSEKRVEETFAAHQRARQDYAASLQGTTNVSQTAERRVGALEQELRASADWPPIRAFEVELERLTERMRAGGFTRGNETRRGPDGHEYLTRAGNKEAVRRLFEAINAARRAVEGLALEALTSDELGDRIEALRQSLPNPLED